ncbi:unnamed protein product [Jaminaea pallidilutea]
MSISRTRKDRPTGISGSNGSEEGQLWTQVRGHLKSIDKQWRRTSDLDTEIRGQEDVLQSLSARDDHSSSAFEEKKQALVRLWSSLKQSTKEEEESTDRALETLGILIALRGSSEDTADIKRKKRRIDESLSPIAVRHTSPPQRSNDESVGLKRAPAGIGGKGEKPTGHRRNTVSSRDKEGDRMDPAKARREVLATQLPLSKGRKVAFRQPNKTKTSGGTSSASNVQVVTGDEEGGETWIMATITECINNDRNRYVVQDAEDDTTPTFNTTLKAIVPLPESINTLPERDYGSGTQVLALYPDTSCFYRAIVKGGGPKMESLTRKQREKRGNDLLNAKYLIEFEDDGGDIKEVAAFLVVEKP